MFRVSFSGASSSISEGAIFIYSCSGQLSSFEIDLISKELNCPEHEYMNMAPSLIGAGGATGFVIHLVFLLSKYKVWSLCCYIRVCDLFISLPLANWCNYNFHVRLNCFRSATLTQPQLCSPVGFKSALVSSQIHVKGFGAYSCDCCYGTAFGMDGGVRLLQIKRFQFKKTFHKATFLISNLYIVVRL